MSTRNKTRVKDRVRLCVLDFAEAASIPVAKARKLVKDLGNDAETLMSAVRNDRKEATGNR
jgi:hypothetical protein